MSGQVARCNKQCQTGSGKWRCKRLKGHTGNHARRASVAELRQMIGVQS